MTFPQLATLLLLSGLLIVFATDRFRIELVALVGLAIGVVLGIVPFANAFDGFANPAVITVAEILLLAGLISRSSLMDTLTRRLARFARSELSVIALVCSLGALTSAFMNNIGALALWVPVTLALCRSTGVAPGTVLIPLSFATLLGGTCSLVGTPANLVVSNFHLEATGRPFTYFELAWVGVPITVLGLFWLVAAAPHLLAGRGLPEGPHQLGRSRPFFAELRVSEGSPIAGLSVAAAEKQLGGTIYTHLRDDRHVFGSRRHHTVRPGDLLLVEADANAITEADRLQKVELAIPDLGNAGDTWIEAVVLPQSMIIGSTARTIEAFSTSGIQIVAIATRLQRVESRLADLQIRVGDILLLHGEAEAIGQALEEVDCLPLSPQAHLPVKRQGWTALIAFVAAIALAATNLVPPEIAFGAAVIVLAMSGSLDLREAITELNWPILLMLAAMIPLGNAVGSTGLADIIAQRALTWIGSSDPIALTATVLVSALVITPFVNNVSAAVALAPIAVALAGTAGISPEPLLVAAAVGVSLDFLTPFGHHNNALVMSIGNYRFGDFARVGLLLTICTAIVAVIVIQVVFR
jgi:di/tricarboxylate transporter